MEAPEGAGTPATWGPTEIPGKPIRALWGHPKRRDASQKAPCGAPQGVLLHLVKPYGQSQGVPRVPYATLGSMTGPIWWFFERLFGRCRGPL